MFKTNKTDMNLIRKISGSSEDCPVLKFNLNKYVAEAGYQNGALYKKYMSLLHPLLKSVS